MSKFNLFIPITKVDEEKRLVYGRVTEERLDKSNEIMDYAMSKPRFEEWSNGFKKATGGLSAGNLRVMHTSKVAGRFDSIDFNDDDKAVEGVAHVVDNDEWNKVLKGCYTGFSIGGGYGKRVKEGSATRYEALPSEVSLVDNPCAHGATFELVRAAGAVELHKFEKELPEEGQEDPAKAVLLKIEATARGLCKAAGNDPDEVVSPEKVVQIDGVDVPTPAVMKWHGFVEDAKRDLVVPGSVDANPGVLQKWVTTDGKTHDSKADAVSHEATLKVAKVVGEIANPAINALSKLGAALDKAEGKTVELTVGEKAFAALTDEDKAALGKATGLDVVGVENFVKGAEPEVVLLILKKKEFSAGTREKLADKGKAMPNGSFPIVNKSDLRNAIRAYGRAKDKPAAKAHIVERAKALGAADELPTDWEGSSAKKGVVIGALAKGMNSVSRLANLVQELHWMRTECEMEAKMEGDSSRVPDDLAENLASLGTTLIAMCEEEVGELVTMGMDPKNVSAMEDILANSYSPSGVNALIKFVIEPHDKPLAAVMTKAATRHDADTMKHIQNAHDSISAAAGGASCDDMSKVAPRDQARLAKAHEALRECGADCNAMGKRALTAGDGQPGTLSKAEGDALRTTISDLTNQVVAAADRLEKLEALPVAEKGTRKAITKGQDAGEGESDDTGDGNDPIEAVAKVLGRVPEADRAMVMMKAAMRNGKEIGR